MENRSLVSNADVPPKNTLNPATKSVFMPIILHACVYTFSIK